MPLPPGLKPGTLAVHAGRRIDPATGSPNTPIYRTAAFTFPSVEQMAETFAGRTERYIYARYGTPSLEEAESRVAALEGCEGAAVFASGMAAITAALLSVLRAGDHLVAQRDLYGGTTLLLEKLLPRLGIEATFVPSGEVTSLARFRRERTKAVYVETPTNPTLRVVDLAEASARAREAGLPLIVDNTFATPINQRPFEAGASIVIHSATKYLAGHGDLIAGVVAASGEALESVRSLRREMGAVLDAEAAWLLARSLRTLPLRVRAQNENAARLAALLEAHPKVEKVHYPGLRSHEAHETAKRQMSGFGGMLSFELKGGEAAAKRFAESLSFVTILPTLGGVETSLLIPAVSSHSMISEEARRAAGVTPGLVRLSAGIEEWEDLEREIAGALERT
jgi:methionine-gamma-lyase